MRIIGGKFKGRTLYGFRGEDIRPTSDNARESLFNILGDISGADFLDLFSGTGAVGIEALSRGAKAVFNDFSRESVALTKANFERLGDNAEVFSLDALSFIKTTRKKFDIIYLDPPYKSDFISELLSSVSEILKDGGRVIFENEKVYSGTAKGLVLTDVRKYGRAILQFFAKKQSGAAVYAGTFDPVTIGHENSILSALDSFGKVFVAIGENAKKTPYFSEDERCSLLKAAFTDKNVEIIKFSDFNSEREYAKFLEKNGVKYYVRGIRNAADFNYEKKAEKRNIAIYPDITTAYIFCAESVKEVSSSKVKSLINKGENVEKFIPSSAQKIFAEIMQEKSRI